MTERFAIRPAKALDREVVSDLIVSCGLPGEGLEHSFPHGYCVAESAGQIIGVGGIEVYGNSGLLRSVAVDRSQQSRSIGSQLVEDRLKWARSNGVFEIYLLTETAGEFFSRFGFVEIERADVPAEIRGSGEYSSVCPESARVMRLGVT